MADSRVVKLPKELVERLKARRRPHQAIAGVIEELLEYAPPVSQYKGQKIEF